MKKLLVVLVLIMAVMTVNAQTSNTQDSTRVSVKVADLQKAITDNIAKDYVGFTIKEATRVTEDNVVTYEILLLKEASTLKLLYDKDGVFLKKLPESPVKK
jgi:hypothetical protein